LSWGTVVIMVTDADNVHNAQCVCALYVTFVGRVGGGGTEGIGHTCKELVRHKIGESGWKPHKANKVLGFIGFTSGEFLQGVDSSPLNREEEKGDRGGGGGG
jgi:hypothetical protein